MMVVKFAVDGWLWCNGVMEVELGQLDVFARKMESNDIGRGWFDTDVFLVDAGCRQHAVIP
jgi:hypothetical protein